MSTENKFYKITRKDLFDLFSRLASDNRIVVPYKKNERLYCAGFDIAKEASIELGGIRQTEPLKSFINPAREDILNGPKQGRKPLIIAGVKACDLSSLLVQDHVFLKGDVEDPFYSENRKNTTIISADCTYSAERCFCLAMDGTPYPRASFDMNLSVLGSDFLVEVATDKGDRIVKSYRMFFNSAPSGDIAKRDAARGKVIGQMRSFIEKRGTKGVPEIQGTVKKQYNLLQLWQDSASTCVECGACNLACPTCHCFLLFDDKMKEVSKRYRIWDACLYNTFARVAGGANARKHLYERLRNRFEKKFDFFPQVLNHYACTGCGRCIEACPGKIDIREVLKGLVNGVWEKPPHK